MVRIKYKETAGIEIKRERPAIGKKPKKAELQRLDVKESKSIREVAEQLGYSKDMVYRSLKEYGIELRPGFNRYKLRKYIFLSWKREFERKEFEFTKKSWECMKTHLDITSRV